MLSRGLAPRCFLKGSGFSFVGGARRGGERILEPTAVWIFFPGYVQVETRIAMHGWFFILPVIVTERYICTA